MQKLLKIVMAVMLGILTGIESHAQTPPYLQKSFANESIQRVESETSGGNISVYGVPASEARVEVFIYGNGRENRLSNDEIKRRLDEQYTLTVSVTDHKLTASAKGKTGRRDWREQLSISFKIYVPTASSTMLRTSGGNIVMKKLTGTQDFRTSGGNLDIDGLAGKINGRTSGGNVDLTDCKDDIDIQTSGGNIDAANSTGKIRLGTSGGNLNLRTLNGDISANTSGGSVVGEAITGDLDAHTSGGNIRLRDLSCSLGASTSAGNLDVSFRQLGKFVNLHNSGGNINVQLPAGKGIDLKAHAEKVRVSSLANFKGDSDEEHIDGSINGGGIPVKIEGSGGRVSVEFK